MPSSSPREDVGLQAAFILIDFLMSVDFIKLNFRQNARWHLPMISDRKDIRILVNTYELLISRNLLNVLDENSNACINSLPVIYTNSSYDTHISLSLFHFLI